MFTAEKFLETVEGNQNYPILLLHLMDKQDASLHIRISSAIMFKNYIKRNWRVVSNKFRIDNNSCPFHVQIHTASSSSVNHSSLQFWLYDMS